MFGDLGPFARRQHDLFGHVELLKLDLTSPNLTPLHPVKPQNTKRPRWTFVFVTRVNPGRKAVRQGWLGAGRGSPGHHNTLTIRPTCAAARWEAASGPKLALHVEEVFHSAERG